MKRLASSLIFFTILIVLWDVAAQAKDNPVLFPRPEEVGAYLWKAAAGGELFHSTWITLRRLFIGYAIGCLAGLPLGLLCARFRLANDTIGVLALGLQTLPSVCWVPLAMLWHGQSETTMQFIVIMGTLWSVLIAVDHGAKHLPPIYVRAARTMGSRGIHTLLRVILPASLPFVLSGMKQGWAFAWRSLMAAEIYVSILTGYGLGHLLHFGRELNSMDQVIGIMIVIILIGLAADKIVFSPGERFLHRRRGTATP